MIGNCYRNRKSSDNNSILKQSRQWIIDKWTGKRGSPHKLQRMQHTRLHSPITNPNLTNKVSSEKKCMKLTCRPKPTKDLTVTKLSVKACSLPEKARLPPMCPGFDSRTRRRMCVVGTLLCSERFFSGYSGFHLSLFFKRTFLERTDISSYFWTSSCKLLGAP